MDKLKELLTEDGSAGGTALYYIIKTGIIIAAILICVAVVNAIFKRARQRMISKGGTGGYLQLVRYVLLAMVYIFGIAWFLADFPTVNGILKSLLAGSGVAAIIISIACQEAIGNLCSGIIIICSRPFIVGDVIRYIDKDISGVVERITLRHTVIRTFENKRLIIPNGTINSCAVENSSYSEDKICMMMDFSLTYESNVEAAMQIISDVVLLNPDYCDNRTQEEITEGAPPVKVLVWQFAESAIIVRAWVWAANTSVSLRLKNDILMGVRARFAENGGIEFAYPHLTIDK